MPCSQPSCSRKGGRRDPLISLMIDSTDFLRILNANGRGQFSFEQEPDTVPGSFYTVHREERNNEMVGSLSNPEQDPRTDSSEEFRPLVTRFRFNVEQVMAHLHAHIAGQEEVLQEIHSMLRLVSADITDPARPLYVTLLLGPTGVGKTELVRTLAEAIHGSRDAFCRVDMNTLSQEHYAASLTGAPPGYVGSKEGVTVLDKGKIEASFSAPGIVLFDEVEKASETVILTLLNVLDNGLMTVASGQQVINFRNALIFMTSNVGVRELQQFAKQEFLGLNEDEPPVRQENHVEDHGASALTLRATSEQNRKLIETRLEEAFSPEFLNRIDTIITFNWLTAESVTAIIEMELARLNKRLQRHRCHICLDDSALSFIRDVGFDVRFGARALKRAIRRHVEIPLADFLLDNQPHISQSAESVSEKIHLIGFRDHHTIRFRETEAE